MAALRLQVGLLGGAHGPGTGRRRRCLLGAQSPSQHVRQHPQRELGIGDEADVDGEVLGDLVGVEVDVDDRSAGGEDRLERREHLGEDVGAADQHRVGLRGDRAAVIPEHVAEHAPELRMGVAHVDLGPVRTPDLGAPDLGQAGQLWLRVGYRNAVTRDDHRPGRPRQQLGHSAELVVGTDLPEIHIEVGLSDKAGLMGGYYFSAVGGKGEMAAPW